jgi:flavin-binding protein dodecin
MPRGETKMPDHVYKTVEITGSSSAGIQDAIDNAITKAASTLRHLDWFEVTNIRGSLNENGIDDYQVTLKIGFRLE